MTATPAVRHLEQLDELINKVVSEAELIHDYVQLRFHGGWVVTLNNPVELDGQLLTNSAAGRVVLASIVGRAVNDVARAADWIVLSFRGGATMTMELRPAVGRVGDALNLDRSSNLTSAALPQRSKSSA